MMLGKQICYATSLKECVCLLIPLEYHPRDADGDNPTVKMADQLIEGNVVVQKNVVTVMEVIHTTMINNQSGPETNL